jgi:hypothetical protein
MQGIWRVDLLEEPHGILLQGRYTSAGISALRAAMNVTLVKSDRRAREKPCLRCGYSLRKLTDTRHCPECGLSIWLSLNSNDSLDWSNPAWLRRISMAAWIMAVAQFVGLAAYALLWRYKHELDRMQAVIAPGVIYTTRPSPFIQITAGAYLLLYGSALLLFAGDEGRYPDKWSSYRWACRITAGAGIVVGSLALVWGGEFWFKAALFASAVSTFAYLRKLAQRIPHSLLVRLCGIVLLAPVLSLLKSVPIFWFLAVFQMLRVIEYLPWLYLPLSAILLGWFAVLFRKSSIAAEEGWLKETGS